MSTFTLTKQNKLTYKQPIRITAGVTVIITILIMAVIGMLSVIYCLVAYRNHINSTTPHYNDFTNSEKSKDNYEINNKVVPDYNIVIVHVSTSNSV